MRWHSLAAATFVAAGCGQPPDRAIERDADGGGSGAGGDGGGAPGSLCEPVRGEPDLGLERVAEGLSKPVFLTAPRGDPRLFVVEQHTGRIRVIAPGGRVKDTPFLDIGGEIGRAIEQGLLGVAFHPDYARNGRFFITYTAKDDRVELEAWRVSDDDPDVADPETRRTLLSVPQDENFHNGGHLHVGPGGDLYVSLGDGGPHYDPEGHAQNPGTLRGSILRLGIDDVEGEEPYRVPADNPFAGEEGARGEVFAFGLRNPWGFGVDPETGHVFVGDVGFDDREEVDVIPYESGGGQNFGWPIYEGSVCLEDGDCDGAEFEAPVYEYENGSTGCAILGGPVYRGCRMPGHHGRFFFTDFCGGWVRSLTYAAHGDPPLADVVEWPGLRYSEGQIGGIGRDGFGELYLMGWESGEVLRIVPE